jgi:hypothetical protein
VKSLFNTTGFEIEDKVFVVLEGTKYYGTVKKTDERLDRIMVDYSAEISRSSALDWFHKSFWEKVTN